MAAIPRHAASGTGNVALMDRGTHLLGVNVAESAGTAAAATIALHDGSDANAPERLRIEVGADGSKEAWFGPQGIRFTDGVFLERVAGETTVNVYVA